MSTQDSWQRSSQLLTPARSRLVVVDVQERLLPSICGKDDLVSTIRFLMDAAELLDVRTIVTEQYPRGLGATVSELMSHTAIDLRLEKLRFSAAEVLTESGEVHDTHTDKASQFILAGIEAHICIQQTALDLLAQGCSVSLAVDGTGSRHREDLVAALERMRHAGVIVTTAESICFEWCEKAGSEQFKALSRLVKDRRRTEAG